MQYNVRMKSVMTVGALASIIALMVVPACTANVWVTPMVMNAYGNVSILGPANVEKTIVLENDGDKPVIVELNSTGSEVEVLFEENEVEIGPGEKKTIHPVVNVEEGRHEGFIKIVAREKGEEAGLGIGASIVTTMSISVTAIGTKVSPPVSVVAIPIAVIAVVIIGYLIYRRRKK